MASVPPSGVRVGERKVLVVDDERDAAELIEFVLVKQGHVVKIASTSEQALKLAVELRPHVALVDIGLPDMDGFELVRTLRKLPQLKYCTFIAVSGYAAPPLTDLTNPFDSYMVKPVTVEAIILAVSKSQGSDPAAEG